MIPFDPNNPYPLLPAAEESYPAEQEHAEAADAWLGLATHATEKRLIEESDRLAEAGVKERPSRLWIGLPVRALLTPYTELRSILEALRPQPGEKVVDLGAGYGRMAFVIARHHPGVEFVGYEAVRERVEEGRRALGSRKGIEILLEDLANAGFSPVEAQFYFIYDYGTRAAIEKTLQDLRRIAERRKITVVGRGRATRDAIEREHPWLSQVVPPDHRKRFSIYRSRE